MFMGKAHPFVLIRKCFIGLARFVAADVSTKLHIFSVFSLSLFSEHLLGTKPIKSHEEHRLALAQVQQLYAQHVCQIQTGSICTKNH